MSEDVRVDVEGRTLKLSNLDKVLYPHAGFAKAEVVDYYSRVAPVLLPHLRDRAATRVRFPDGVDGQKFFEKNAPIHTPRWVRTVEVASPGSSSGRDTVRYVVVDDLPTLVWCANLAALELHTFQWKVGPRGAIHDPDLLVFDLDPGPPADVLTCCRVAGWLRDALAADGLDAWPKTSGRKGLQLYVPIEPTSSSRTSDYAKSLAQRLERDHRDKVVSKMAKELRRGKVFIDWSQNNAAKTTVTPYSLRANDEPTVSTPLSWDELDRCRSAHRLRFTSTAVLDRVDERGDLFAPLLEVRQPFPG